MIAAILVATSLLNPPAASLATDSPIDLPAAIAERAAFGLDARPGIVSALVGSVRDVGTRDLGIPMTADEMAEVDLEGRMEFATAASRGVLAWARELPAYGGAYFDQTRGGNLTILLTGLTDATAAEIHARAPKPNRGIEVASAEVTYSSLVEAVVSLDTVWAKIMGDMKLNVAAADVRANALRIEVAPEDVMRVRSALPRLTEELRVPVRVVAGEQDEPQICSSRTNCHTPMKAGIRINRGSTTGTLCTMGFHVVRNGDYQFLTSGHCGYKPGSSSWYHTGWYNLGHGDIGVKTDSAYQHLGDDVMWVDLPNTGQPSDDIYAEASTVAAMDRPVTGQAVCASLGNTATKDCGTVVDDFMTYSFSSEYGGYTLYGADHDGIATGGGDSGSPIYVDLTGAVAVGVHSSDQGRFARIVDVLPPRGWNVVR